MRAKILALALALALLAAPAALGEEIMLTEERALYFGENATPEGKIGALLCWGFYEPERDMPECMGTDTLILEFARPGVTGGEGFLRVLNAQDDSLFFEGRGNDPECVDCQPSEMGGTDMYVTLDEPLESGERYYLQLDEGAAVAEGGLVSEALDTKQSQQLLVGDFGLDEMDMAEEYFVGVTMAIPVLLGSMDKAVIEADGEYVTLDRTELIEDGAVRVTPVKAGMSEINVSFYNASGEYVNGLIVPVEAQG